MDAPSLDLCSIVNQLPIALIAIDRDGNIACMNRLAMGIFHVSGSIKRNVGEICPEFGEALVKVSQTGVPLREKKVQIRGSSFAIDMAPIQSNGNAQITGAVAVLREDADSVVLEEELRDFKNLQIWIDSIFDSSFDGLWITDHEGKIIRINKASERIIAIPAERIVGRNVRELIEEGSIDRSVTLEVLKKKTSVTMLQNLGCGKRVLATGSPIFNERGEITFIVINDRDITELDHLRRKLQDAQALADGYFSRISELEIKGVDPSALILRSKEMQRVLKTALRVAAVDSTVMLLGESGVGKGLISKLIHKNSQRSKGPFIRVDCSGVPDSLMESELFGYEKGAFTGANKEGKPGFFELAEGGTLFLDEITEIPLQSQSKLLRFLEEHEITRVGGTKAKKVNLRIIAATNRNIEELVAGKRFREDVYYRLNVIPIHIPPLRERREDILPLCMNFLDKFNNTWGKEKTFSPEVIEVLLRYDFPGNVRELANLIERLVVISEKERIELTDLPAILTRCEKERHSKELSAEESPLNAALENYERSIIEKAIKKFGSQREAAKALKVDQATISRKIKKFTYAILHN